MTELERQARQEQEYETARLLAQLRGQQPYQLPELMVEAAPWPWAAIALLALAALLVLAPTARRSRRR